MLHTSFTIYNASAGAGKTHTLVKEYLKILLLDSQDDAYKKILAITFTNKAVEEMKTRIVSFLYAFAQKKVPQKYQGMLEQIVEETGSEEMVLKSKSARIIKNIIHNYAAFDISTIDKFTHKVIRSFAFDLNLPTTFEVSLDTEELLQEAVDAVIAKAGSDAELTALLIDFSLEKTDSDKSWDMTRELFEIGKLLLSENNREEIALFADKGIIDFVEARNYLKDRIEELSEEVKNTGLKIRSLIEEKEIDRKSFSGEYFPRHVDRIIDDSLSATHKRYYEFEDIRINKTARDKELIQDCVPFLLDSLSRVYSIYAKRDFCSAFLNNIVPLSLLSTLDQEMNRIQKEQNILSIAQFNTILYNEIQQQPAPFIYERLGEKYKHFFIDEFQDTSEMQWKNLIPLIDNALAGEDERGVKGSLMIVGDPKQSIYRWRGGKAEQFIALSKKENPFSNPDKQTVVLGKNYRSYSQVVEFNNLFFKGISKYFEEEDYRDLYADTSSQEVNSKKGGYVQLSFLEKGGDLPKEERYAQQVLKKIEEAKAAGFAYADIVVLTRRRSEGVFLANYLTESEIPILSSDSLLINNSSEVRLIIHVLRYLRNTEDLEAKALILYHVALQKTDKGFVHDFIEEGMALRAEKEFESWLEAKGVRFSFLKNRKRSLYETVERIVRAFLPKQATTSYVLYFTDLILEKTVKNNFGISDFLDYWSENYEKVSIPTPSGVDAVQLMTIHKSKGLEFPVVIFPFAEEDYSRAKKDKLWLQPEEMQINLPRVLVDSKKEVMEYGDEAKKVYFAQEQEALLDNVNVLYVALTRAEERLYIISRLNINKGGSLPDNMSTFFIDFLMQQGLFEENVTEYDFGDKDEGKQMPKKESDNVRNETIQSVRHPLNFDSIKIAQREALMWDTEKAEAIEYGNIVHKVMSLVAYRGDVEKALDQSIEEGVVVESQREVIREVLERIVAHPELEFFFRDEAEVFTERMIVSQNHPNLIPDRVVIQEGRKVGILDYKTGKPKVTHREQVEKYAEVLDEMGMDSIKKALIYIGPELNVIHL